MILYCSVNGALVGFSHPHSRYSLFYSFKNIPAMSSEAEHVFSATKKTIHQDRWSLKANTIEGLECLKSWFQAGYYTQADLHEALIQDAAAEQLELDDIEFE